MPPKKSVKNRWLMALSAVGVHLPIGSVYAYSVLILPLNELHGWSRTQIMAAFSLAILLLGFSAAFLGPRIQRIGPARSARLAASLYVSGILVAAFGVKMGSFPLFLLGYGAISGVGLGIGYVTPVGTLLQWFPDRKGLATGMAVMGFGFGSLVFGPVMAWMMQIIAVWQTLCILAGVYGVMMYASSCYLAPPPEGWLPAGCAPKIVPGVQSESSNPVFTVKRTVRSSQFILLWCMLFINISCGISIIGMASPMAQEIANLNAMEAAGLIGIMGLCNGAGRFFWAWLSDHLGRPQVFMLFFLLQTVAFILLPTVQSTFTFQAILLLIVSCYGGGFALLPAFLADMFGTPHVVSLFGFALTAWGLAGIAGPSFSSAVTTATGSYSGIIYGFAFMMAMGATLAICLLLRMRSGKA